MLEFMATHPGQQFTLSELCRQLNISKSTGFALMNTLVERGWVLRHPTLQTFSLGPALLPVGDAAWRMSTALTEAKAAADELADRLDVESIISVASHGEILVLTHSGVPHPGAERGRPGARLPLAPPLGTVFLAWATDDQVQSWIARLSPAVSEPEVASYRAALERTRERGFAIGYHSPAYVQMAEMHTTDPGWLETPAGRDMARSVMEELGQQEYLADHSDLRGRSISYIGAPVFGPRSEVLLALSIVPGARFSPEDAPSLGRELVATTSRLTHEIDGQRPDVSYLGALRHSN
jgi:DNA-binding IclR family transcriptional regulator